MSNPFVLLFILLIQILFFLAPGVCISIWLNRKRYFDTLYLLPLSAVFSCLLAYGAFWAFLIDHRFGQLYSLAVIVFGCVGLAIYIYKKLTRKLLLKFDVLIPLIIWILATLLYTGLTFGCRNPLPTVQTNQYCYLHNTTFDNLLPKIFADNVYQGHPKTLMGDWRGSDRPPLQTGITLLQFPLTQSVSISFVSYQMLAVFAQLLWLPLVWLLGRRLNLTNYQLAIVITFCLCSGFFFFNSVFVWPKLLAGSLAGIGFSLLLFEKQSIRGWLLAALAISCGLLAHTGVVFALLPIALLPFTKWVHWTWRPILVALVVTAALLLPWLAYQHLYDPPGDRLAKWELAGDTTLNDLSFAQDLKNAYQEVGVKGSLENKFSNAYTVFYARDNMNHLYSQNLIGNWRDMEFRFVFFGLGLANLGWLVLLVPSLRRRLKKSMINLKRLKLTLSIVFISLIAWILIMFGPGTTIIHGGSYLNMILLFTCLASLITIFPKFVVKIILGLKFLLFILVWVISIYMHNVNDLAYVLWSLLATVSLAYCLYALAQGKLVEART